jgi:hypothetical protein
MKGAMALPSVRNNSNPNMSKVTIIGISQYFFLNLINSHISFKIESLPMQYSS